MDKKKQKTYEVKNRVVVAMSGGVDSSVAAALLKEEGYDVIGVFMKNWSEPVGRDGVCPWVQDQKDVLRVCDKLGIPCYTFNFEKEYNDRVVKYFFDEYKQGRTPNPDVMCNKEVKFDIFRKSAEKLGADYIATGHYARVKDEGGSVRLFKGVDESKDQSYFLWMLSQKELKGVLFPVGKYTKKKVRELAEEFGLPTATKKDSQGICFIGPIKVRNFLKTRISSKRGPVVTSDGSLIGEHEGVWFYTIGQHLGLDKINWPDKDIPPLYVKDKVVETNTLIVGLDNELYGHGLICDNIHWVNQIPELPVEMDVVIRYRHSATKALVEKIDDNKLKILFDQPQRAITPGQSVVFYSNDELVGGGIIVKNLD